MNRKRGPVPSSDISVGFRELRDSPHAKLLYQAGLMEGGYFPFMWAETPEEKSDLEIQIGLSLGLPEAKENGLILGYEVLWSSRRFPMNPSKLNLFPPEREGHKPGHGWERFVSRTFLREMRGYFRRFSNPEWRAESRQTSDGDDPCNSPP